MKPNPIAIVVGFLSAIAVPVAVVYLLTPQSLHLARTIEAEHISPAAIQGALMISQANAAQAEAMLSIGALVLLWGMVGLAVVVAVWVVWKGER